MIKTIFPFIVFLFQLGLLAETTIVAHRGASKEAPENTLPAFELAWKQGADAIEADFHLTKDGHVVCIHDANTKRVSGKKLVVAQSNLSDLQKLDVGSFRGTQFKGTKIPTIGQVFACIPKGKKIYIEIKSSADTVGPILDEIKKSSLQTEQIVFISFKEKVLAEVKKKAPHLYTSWLCNIKKNKQGQLKPSQESILQSLREMNANGLSASQHAISPVFIQELHTNGYQFHVWTVNSGSQAKRFIQWKTDSITTDMPQIIKTASMVAPK